MGAAAVSFIRVTGGRCGLGSAAGSLSTGPGLDREGPAGQGAESRWIAITSVDSSCLIDAIACPVRSACFLILCLRACVRACARACVYGAPFPAPTPNTTKGGRTYAAFNETACWRRLGDGWGGMGGGRGWGQTKMQGRDMSVWGGDSGGRQKGGGGTTHTTHSHSE